MSERLKNIAIYGAGGFGREVSCLIEEINKVVPTWNFVGFFDNRYKKGDVIDRGPIAGTIEDLNSITEPLSIVICNGQPEKREIMRNEITSNLVNFPNIVHPDTYFSDPKLFSMGCGNIITKDCNFSIAIKLGDFNVFNGDFSMGHDCTVGNYNSFMPSVRISGNVTINDYNYFGVSSTVIQGLKIGNNVRLGANSALIRNPKDNNLYIGVPAKKF